MPEHVPARRSSTDLSLPKLTKPMNPTRIHARVIAAGVLASLVCVPIARAQTTPASPPNKNEEVVTLTEFSVRADPDRGYVASETLTGSRVRTPIIDLPYTVNVLTSE